jgi:hypothetical protein
MSTAQACVIPNVPDLGWGKNRECTFLGALEAALAATGHPTDYVDLMGFTALAFRTRWWKATDKILFCPSTPVGEMQEEIEAADHASGWPLHVRLPETEDARRNGAADIIRSLDAGKPVLAYDSGLNMGVVYGYDDGGRRLKLKGYGTAGDVEAAKLGWMWVLLGDYRGAPPREESGIRGLKTALTNFHRVTGQQGPGEYWYGKAAFEHWIGDLSSIQTLSEQQRQKLFFVSWWNFTSLADARRAAVEFVARYAPATKAAFAEEADLFDSVVRSKDAFLGPWTGKKFEDWTDSIRHRECDVLTRALEIEQRAFTAIEKSLRA